MIKFAQIIICIGFLVVGNVCQAQKSMLLGDLKDQQTNEPIAYAHIIFTKAKYGTTTNEKGRFLLQVDSTLLRQSVRISCLGYQSKELPSSALSNRITYLTPSVEKLDEVVVYDVKEKENSVTLNPFRGKQWVGLGNFSGGAYPSVLARYYPNDFETNEKLYLDKVIVYLSPPYRWESKFKLRILGASSALSPAEDLLLSSLVVQTRKSQRKVEISLSEYAIEVPDNGFFVAVEHLFILENQFQEQLDVQLADTLYQNVKTLRYGPIFRGIQENPETSHSYYRSNKGWKSMKRLKLSNRGNTFKNGKTASPAFKVKVVY